MKYKILSYLFFNTFFVFAQFRDTVFVNSSGVTLIFPSEINVATVSYSKDYIFETKGKVFTILTKREESKKCALVIDYGDGEIFNTIIKYKNDITENYIDFRKTFKIQKSEDEKTKELELEIVKIEKDRVKKKLDELLDLSDEIKSVGVKEGNLLFSLSAMRIDDNYCYLMFNLKNDSPIAFKIDYFRFQAVDKVSNDESKIDKEDEDIKPIIFNDIESVQPKSSVRLLYAIPLYGIGQKGGYKVIIKEKKGNRKPILIIKSKIISNAKQI